MVKKLVVLFFLSAGGIIPPSPLFSSIVLIDPAGHAKDSGRLLVTGYERAETLKFAQALKKKLHEKYSGIRTVISRSPGEEISPLQISSFSNRLRTNFFLRIQMYRQESEKPKIFLYHHLFNDFVDCATNFCDPLRLVPLHEAHFKNIAMTKFYGTRMYDFLNGDNFKKYFDCESLIGLPLRSLVGMTAPAIALEVGICREDKWQSLVEPVVDSLSFLKG